MTDRSGNGSRRRSPSFLALRFLPSVLCLLPFAFCLVAASPSDATVLLPADFQEVVNGSQIIVRGTVSDVRSEMTAGRRTIQSLISVAVIEAIKGQAGPTITFKVPNGQVGRYRRVMVGAPEFEVGDQVIVFLRAAAPAIPNLFGLSQGVYRVARGGADGDLVTPPPVMTRGFGAQRVVRGDPVRSPLPVTAFVRDVRAVMAARR